jgi:glycosyltransferase involved in cell wall biosynthesis
VHEWFPWSISWESGNPVLKRIRAWLYHLIHSFLCNRTDHIIVTEELKIGLFQSTVTHSRITTIKNFPPLELFKASRKSFHRNRFVIAYAGGLSRERGIYDLARATQVFSERSGLRPELLLIGDFYSPGRRQSFMDSFATPVFELQITGWIPHPQVPISLRNADVCAIPWPRTVKFLRSLPVKLYEYMALSKPVIASNFGEMRRVIQQTQCGILVDPSNPERIADVIAYYYNNPDLVRQHGQNGRKWVEKQYNWAQSAQVFLSIYANLGAERTLVSE